MEIGKSEGGGGEVGKVRRACESEERLTSWERNAASKLFIKEAGRYGFEGKREKEKKECPS